MLSPGIREFLDEMGTLKAIGCLLIPQREREGMAVALEGLDWPHPIHVLAKGDNPASATAPCLLLVSEEDYSSDPDWAERLRDVAEYFWAVPSFH